MQSDAKTALGFASIWYSAENQRMKDLEFFNRILRIAATRVAALQLAGIDPKETSVNGSSIDKDK